MKRAPFSPRAFRQITRPLIRADGTFDRKKIFADARARFAKARMKGKAITWARAMFDAWEFAHRQIALASSFDANSIPLAA
ncbi:hypothetical protein [Methylocystis parvus]|uniref:hypothetical protein n=1 Tax=Methylocystis parvus TaxID=134 RepID=UPI003C7163B0